jgi:hypothetical protein
MGVRGPETERNIAVFALGGLIIVMIVAVGVRSWLARRERGALGPPPMQPFTNPTTAAVGYFPHVTLHGPDGDQTIPGSDYTVVHVWLQGCQDCIRSRRSWCRRPARSSCATARTAQHSAEHYPRTASESAE